MAADSPDLGVDLSLTLPLVVEAIERWQESYGGVESAPVSAVDAEAWRKTLDQFLVRLTDEQYPFFHPHYAGQMLKPPHPVAVRTKRLKVESKIAESLMNDELY